ncbi:hypothetical protein JYK02_04990 [Corallococcus macrosporus]|uniref:Transporter n=1 Tax=Corallococcus macrosporus TaxID=35 RepID=A0ABS3D5B6_9BACT|nr:hypothetical protein [Corallococcus macrosporus]MBN8226863.1 hypothetical protein [Corallococcus macrosporus]
MPRFICLIMLLWWVVPPSFARAEEPGTASPETSSQDWFENPTRTRSLVGPTALPLHAGEGYIGQQAFLITAAEVGLSERVSLNAASVIPIVALARGFSDVPFSLLAGIKVTFPLTERLHLAFGAQGGTFDSDLGGLNVVNGVAAYGVLTYGTGDAYVSLTVQPIFTWGSMDESGSAMVLPMLGGFIRLGRHWGLAADVALSPVEGISAPFAFATAGGRLLGQHWSVDLGVLAGKQLHDSTLAVVPGASFLFHWR